MARMKILFLLLAAMVLMAIMVLPVLNTAVQAEPAITPTLSASEWAFLPMVHGFGRGQTATPIPSQPTATASSMFTPTPSNTPAPTNTPTATYTPTPTPTETPLPEPVIRRFYAQPNVILSGQETTLQWEVVGPHDALVLELGSVNNTVDVTGRTEYTFSPTETTQYTMVAYYGDEDHTSRRTTVTIGETGEERLLYNWNGPVNQDSKGFPYYQPPAENGDWTSPINFAEGTLYFYVEIIKMPRDPKEMRLEHCFWQDNFSAGAEQCADKVNLTGNSGTVVKWADSVQRMWSKPDRPKIDWTRGRLREAFVIKTKTGDPVSPWTEPIWGGDDPREWYPFEWHAMAVIVEAGKAFSGWDNYLDDAPIPTPTPEP